jgi:hypothetical protein
VDARRARSSGVGVFVSRMRVGVADAPGRARDGQLIQALLVLAHLRNGDTHTRLAAGFGIRRHPGPDRPRRRPEALLLGQTPVPLRQRPLPGVAHTLAAYADRLVNDHSWTFWWD